MSNASHGATVIDLAALSARRPARFDLTADAAMRGAIARALGLVELRKLRFAGQIAPDGDRDWQLTGNLGATAVQPCVVTLDPVTTRIDTPVIRHYVAGLRLDDGPVETEMPEDDSQEPLSDRIDLLPLIQEALALALPDYPRSDAAGSGSHRAAPPGAEPLEDEDTRPFAGLAGLKARLEGDG